MKRSMTIVFALLLLGLAPSLYASKTRIADDVIRMWQSNVSESSIISYIHSTKEPIDVTADDVIAMTKAKVPQPVIKTILDEAAARANKAAPEGRAAIAVYPPWYPQWYWDPFYQPFWPGQAYLGFSWFGGYHGGFHGGDHDGGHHGGEHGHR